MGILQMKCQVKSEFMVFGISLDLITRFLVVCHVAWACTWEKNLARVDERFESSLESSRDAIFFFFEHKPTSTVTNSRSTDHQDDKLTSCSCEYRWTQVTS